MRSSRDSERRTMFKLEEKIIAWRKTMQAAGFGPGAVRDELESHLRDSFASRVQSGQDPDCAFIAAAEKLGPAREIQREFNAALSRRDRIKRFLGRRVEFFPTDMRLRIYIGLLTGLVLAGVFVVLRPPPAQSTAFLQLKLDPSLSQVLPKRVRASPDLLNGQDLSRLAAVLSNENTLQRVTQALKNAGPDGILHSSDAEKGVAFLKDHLTINTPVRASLMLEVTFRHPDSSIPRRVLETYLATVTSDTEILRAAFPGPAVEKIVRHGLSLETLDRPGKPWRDWDSLLQPAFAIVLAACRT